MNQTPWHVQQWKCEEAMRAERERLRRCNDRLKALCAIDHGHQFGDNRKCHCGVSEKEYRSTRPTTETPVCEMAR